MPVLQPVTSYPLESLTMIRRWIIWLGQQEEAIRRVAILTILYLMPAIWILRPVIVDPDIWWHLQTGKWIVDHGTLPTTDPFSSYGEGNSWVAYSWLFEVGMYGLLQVFGETGLVLYTLVSAWSIMLVLHWIIGTRCSDFVGVCGWLAACVVALSGMFTPRPWLLTILFFAITLQVVLSLRDGKDSRAFWLLPIAYVIWANMHIQFIYGLGLLGLASVAPLIDHLAQPYTGTRPVMAWRSPQWSKLVGLTGLCAFATLVTPYHVRLYSIVVELSAQTGMWEYIKEMQAPAFRSIDDWAMLALVGIALVQLGWRRSWSSFEILFLFVAGASAFRGQRDVWFLVLAAVVVLLPIQIRETKKRWSIVPRGRAAPVACCVAAAVICIAGFRGFSEVKIQENTGKIYPIEAASFVERQGYSGPLYNHFDWGGYLIWRLPHLKVSMDGRANVHGDDRIKQALSTWAGNPHWMEDPELNKAGVIIAQKDMALTALLHLDPRFQLAYQDETAVVFTRARQGRDQSNAPALKGFSSDPPVIADLAPTR